LGILFLELHQAIVQTSTEYEHETNTGSLESIAQVSSILL